MRPIPHPTPLSTLVTQSDLELTVVADILGIGLGSLNNFLTGRKDTPPAIIGEMTQIMEDIKYWETVLTNFQQQGGELPHPRVVQIALYNVANS